MIRVGAVTERVRGRGVWGMARGKRQYCNLLIRLACLTLLSTITLVSCAIIHLFHVPNPLDHCTTLVNTVQVNNVVQVLVYQPQVCAIHERDCTALPCVSPQYTQKKIKNKFAPGQGVTLPLSPRPIINQIAYFLYEEVAKNKHINTQYQ